MPERVRLSRTKGWRMPPNTAKVDRTSRFGNPFTESNLREAGFKGSTAEAATYNVDCFRRWLAGSNNDWMGPEAEAARTKLIASIPDLRGKNLACWCPLDGPCHADVLLEIANV
jgi:hypothetical protein